MDPLGVSGILPDVGPSSDRQQESPKRTYHGRIEQQAVPAASASVPATLSSFPYRPPLEAASPTYARQVLPQPDDGPLGSSSAHMAQSLYDPTRKPLPAGPDSPQRRGLAYQSGSASTMLPHHQYYQQSNLPVAYQPQQQQPQQQPPPTINQYRPHAAQTQQGASSSTLAAPTQNGVGRPRSPFASATPASFVQRGYPDSDQKRLHDPDVDQSRSTSSSSQQRVKEDPFVRVRVLALDRTKKELWIKLDATTNLSSYHHGYVRAFTRSSTDFAALHSALASNHPQTIVPALPFSSTSALTDEEEDRIVRSSYQRWLNRVCKDAGLMSDEELRVFIEADFGYTAYSKRQTKTGSSLLKFKSATDEDDELGSAKKEMSKLEHHLTEAAKAIDKDAKARKTLSLSLQDLAEKFTAFSTTETHQPLNVGLRRLADALRRISEVENVHSTSDCVTVGDGLAYEAAEAREARETLMHRQSTVDEHRAAVKNTITRKREIERLKASSSIKSNRATEALEEFETATKQEAILAQKLDAVSQRLLPSLHSHTRQMNQDTLQTLAQYARATLAYEKQLLKELDAVVPDLEKIPARSSEDAYYVHPPPPLDSSQRSATGIPRSQSANSMPSPDRGSLYHSRSGSVPVHHSISGSRSPGGPIANSQTGAQSMILPRGQPNRINQLANSVHIDTTGLPTRQAETFVEPHKRVDARAAASLLSNHF
ncbi:uncharacterized protein L969DRAFT_84013 [Mixia osmundae IAM 14324]|uniref:PX domain-containing protein n=1 Tax=Mixia osmundae (strain CBS 9802 / IAM 14324 / JCM 22182 / KY 12970) TaxID=764103 RepID=G7DZY7_MIXOS|nr:uncharacterized protein L969DRAFT_84013 [Mixia osmundae IAM 14324]KEI42138.1 hypothetical protein L969DRAFT_84013 [Mixia osmundae IAM 14324]GAA96147.1 hypothetical protein E5Q_02808 [Mixia osmundae IAM 14324]